MDMKALLSWMLYAFLVCGLAQADDKGADKGNPTRWLSQGQEQTLIDSVPSPPVPGSDEDNADLAHSLSVQKSRNDAMIAEARRDQKFDYTLFASIYGAEAGKNPKFIEMMKNVLAACWAVNETAKNKFQRPRPYQGHPDKIHALFPVKGYSYPSGHAMGSYTLAVVLGAIFPDKKQAFLDRAAQISESRVDAGVHYFSDIVEGGKLGMATGNDIVASLKFQDDLRHLQTSLRKK